MFRPRMGSFEVGEVAPRGFAPKVT